MSRTTGVYELRCPATGRRYIGSGIWVENRLASHWSKLRRGRHYCRALQEEYDRYGQEGFEVRIWAAVDYRAAEHRKLEYWRSRNMCYNTHPVFGKRGPLSAETKAKLSAIHKGSCSNKGYRWTPEQRARLSEVRRAYYANKR